MTVADVAKAQQSGFPPERQGEGHQHQQGIRSYIISHQVKVKGENRGAFPGRERVPGTSASGLKGQWRIQAEF